MASCNLRVEGLSVNFPKSNYFSAKSYVCRKLQWVVVLSHIAGIKRKGWRIYNTAVVQSWISWLAEEYDSFIIGRLLREKIGYTASLQRKPLEIIVSEKYHDYLSAKIYTTLISFLNEKILLWFCFE